MSDPPITNPPVAPNDRKVRQVELLISTLLRVGVVVSLTVVVAGTLVTFARHPDYLYSRQDLSQLTNPARASFPRSIPELLHGLREFQGRAIVVAGLLLLIATPVMRVAVSIFAFIYERDGVFVIITSIVLAMLLASFLLGKAGG